MYQGYAPGMTVTPILADRMGEHGWIECKQGDNWIIKFVDGDEWLLTESELDNRAHFNISPPRGLRQCLLRVQYGYDVQGLNMGDDPMFEAIEEISGHTADLIKLLDKNSHAV